MPLYEFCCPGCGPFDVRRGMSDATHPANCPSCAGPGRRVYTTGAGVQAGPVPGARRADRMRWDRARSGEPAVTATPSGRRLPRSGTHRH
jgi:putative FmdB family regulatory protein